jgi:hypothetical protein
MFDEMIASQVFEESPIRKKNSADPHTKLEVHIMIMSLGKVYACGSICTTMWWI